MRRLLVVLAAAGAVVTAAAPAFADTNGHNCEGVANSIATPDVVDQNQQGARTSDRAQSGGQATFVQMYNDPLANCGATP